MSNRISRLTLIVISLAAMVGLAGGCAAIPQEIAQGTAPVAAATDKVVETAAEGSPPAINSFGVTPTSIGAGQSAVLSWDVSGAKELAIAPGIGSGGSGTISKGSEQVSPASTTTYMMTATNEFGSITRSATVTVTASGERLVDFDPVSGRNDEIDLKWEQLCLASEYQVQIAKDPGFSIIVLDTGPFHRIVPASNGFVPADPTAPGAYFPAGGQIGVGSPLNSAIGLPGVLEAGHNYYVRFRVTRAATGQRMYSPWSAVYRYAVKSGLATQTPSYGPQPLFPSDRFSGCAVSPVSFSWSPFKDTSRYRFQLARDAAMTQIVAEADVPTTAYAYQGSLGYDMSYFWRVMAVLPVPSDWSAVFTFHTMAAQTPTAPPASAQAAPLWAWVIIVVVTALVIAVLALVFITRQRKA